MAGIDPRRVALVTGASSGIGRATAEAFVARGYATALIDRDADEGRWWRRSFASPANASSFTAT